MTIEDLSVWQRMIKALRCVYDMKELTEKTGFRHQRFAQIAPGRIKEPKGMDALIILDFYIETFGVTPLIESLPVVRRMNEDQENSETREVPLRAARLLGLG